MMNDRQISSPNLFTLVSYTPEPLRSWLLRLRESLPVYANSEPHLTILPPRPLILTADDAKQRIMSILQDWCSFEIELSDVRIFTRSNVLYLDVNEGSNILRELHSQLNSGAFAHHEMFEFHPHVTIGGPVTPGELETVVRRAGEAWRASACPCRLEIRDVAFVSIEANGRRGDWRRLWTRQLARTRAQHEAVAAAATSRTF